MSRDELVRLFPNGNTMHIPADGRPLPGYEQAVADYKRRVSSGQVQMASSGAYSGSSSDEPRKHKTLFAALFGGGADEAEDTSDDDSGAAPVAIAKATPPKAADMPNAADPGQQAPAQPTEVASVNAPIPQVRPAFADQPGGSEVASALVAPQSGNAAQQALSAVTDQGPQQFADLSAYSIPVPSLLGPRRPAGDAEVASADPTAMTGNLAAVPRPAERPALAENLLAAANADAEANDDVADQEDTLSPAVADALDQHDSDGDRQVASSQPPVSSVEQAINAAMPQKVPTQKAPVQMAALAPATRSTGFGDGFDAPRASDDAGIAQGVPAKGGRPTKHEAAEADASRATVRTEPKLTEKIISKWALTNSRMEMVTKPVKAPRFVSQTLRAQPTSVYAEGFTKTASIDPGRFSGTAVNFMEVRKFDSN
jgi:hypothetical protein